MSESSQAAFVSYTSQDAEAAVRIASRCEPPALRYGWTEVNCGVEMPGMPPSACPAGQVSGDFVARIARLLSPDVQQTPPAGVLPFENATGDPTNEYLGNGIAESLINKLAGLSDLHVISRTSAFAFKGKAADPTEIGRKLGVDALVLGNLTVHGSRLNISASS
jgi:TolB-like protein